MATILLNRGRLTFREIQSFIQSSSQNSAASGRVGATSAPSSSLSASAQPTASSSNNHNGSNASGSSLGGSMGQGQVGGTWTSNISAVHTTPLSRTLIQHALLVLVQHNMLYHVRLLPDGTFQNPDADLEPKDEDEDKTKEKEKEEAFLLNGTEYFELNPSEIFPRVRFGWYLEMSESAWGKKGREVMSEILKMGKIKAGDLMDHLKELDWQNRMRENGFEINKEEEDIEKEEDEEVEEEVPKGRKGKSKGKEKEIPKKAGKRKRNDEVERIDGESLERVRSKLIEDRVNSLN